MTTKKPQIKWQLHVPNLFFQMARAAVVLAIVYHLINGVWNISLEGLGTGLGVASAVIALALQDTLSNLVSGLLLLFANPFKTGDWIELNGTQGRVIEQNWWSVTIENYFFKISIPNGELSKASIINYGQGPIWKNIFVSFSYNDSPGVVIPALNSLVEGIEEIKSEGSAEVSSYGDSSITYELWYKVLPEEDEDVSDELRYRIYYLAKRYGFSMPYESIESNDKFASEILEYIEERKKIVRLAKGIKHEASPSMSNNGRRGQVRS